jgi:D-alanyl-lipoteichoic acid acyltransferase DltB (MBOAT superfamily)
LGLLIGIAILILLFRLDWKGQPFALEHAAKVIGFYLAAFPTIGAAVALWRLFGGQARDCMDLPLLARTPADFWRRYNRPLQQFFHADVFRPAGGLRSPIRATLLVFALSAAIHEYIFGMAIGRVQGYQTAFFMLQGCAVAATIKIKPEGRGRPIWIIGTLLFNLALSVLIFASVNGLLRFYSRGLPACLQGW